MRSIFGMEVSSAGQYLIAFIVIFALLALFALVLRRLTGRRMSSSAHSSARSRQPRLGIVDIYDLDRQRQLLLLRRDHVEHLVMIGGPNDVVIEQGIARSQPARMPSGEPAEQWAEPAERRPEPAQRPMAGLTPVPARAGEPRSGAEPRLTPRSPAAGSPVAARIGEASPSPRADQLSALSRTEPKPVDESRLSDMSRQLEEALKKPFSAVRPSTAVAAPSEPPAPPSRRPDVTPMAPRMPTPPGPGRTERPERPADQPDRPARAEPGSTVRAAPEPSPMPGPPLRPRPAPVPVPEAAKAEPAPARPPDAAPKRELDAVPKNEKDLDPFSPEAIEAEFARLLGRSSTKSEG